MLASFENTDINFKRRKIKVGLNYNLDVDDYYDKIENSINLDETEFERQDLLKVYNGINCPLSNEEVDKYLKNAKLFWTYSNCYLESDLNQNFIEDLETFLKTNRLLAMTKKHNIDLKLNSLKQFLKFGLHLNNHFDEMALKILHIANYQTNVALLFLYKNMNPFLEGKTIFFLINKILDEEEGFKNDVLFFQREIVAYISDDEN